MNKKSAGFTGERIIEIPRDILKKCKKMPLINALFISKMGFYPKAQHHYYRRAKGFSETILIYCTGGTGWIKLPDFRITLKTGDIYMIPSGIPHSYGSTKESPWTIYWLHLMGTLDNESIRAVMGNAALPEKGLYIGVNEERLSIFDRMENSFLKGYGINNLMYSNLLLPYFISSLIAPDKFVESQDLPEQKSHVEKAILFMQNNLSHPVSLPVLAKAINLSVSFFSRLFKKETGYSPMEYLNHLRIQRACQLLHVRNLRVNEVAARVGIEDPFYFSRIFKSQIGISPARYRKAELSNKD